jgi:hypothetical protein
MKKGVMPTILSSPVNTELVAEEAGAVRAGLQQVLGL